MELTTESPPQKKVHAMIEPSKPIVHLRDERLTDYTECGLVADGEWTNAELLATCPKCINWRAGTLEYRAKQLRTVQREIERSIIPNAAPN